MKIVGHTFLVLILLTDSRISTRETFLNERLLYKSFLMREKKGNKNGLVIGQKKVIGIIPGTIFLKVEKICYYSKIGE
jgi:hypothetical protein